jgi:mono/diheme cytochrome c family protein
MQGERMRGKRAFFGTRPGSNVTGGWGAVLTNIKFIFDRGHSENGSPRLLLKAIPKIRVRGGNVLVIIVLALALGTVVCAQMSYAFDAPAVFEKQCSSCHSIGGGDDVGPDLKGVMERRKPEWLMRFIRESQSVIASGDSVAVDLFEKFRRKKMPDQDFSDAEVLVLLDYIKSGGSGASTSQVKSALKSTDDDVSRGRDFFIGKTRLANGGPACAGCHGAGLLPVLGGGTLGPDLTSAYSTYTDSGLSKVLTRISFPTMAELYASRPLTEEEVFAIKAFLFQTDKHGPVTAGYEKKFLFLGILGLLAGLGVIDLSWRNRRRKTSRPIAGGDE